MWILDLDLVDDVDAEVQMNRFIAQDVLILLGDADHLVAAAEREDLGEPRIEPHALEDDVEGDEITQERLVGFRSAGLEIGIVKMLGVLQRPRRLSVIDGTSRYMLNSSPSSNPKLSTMYWNVWV